MGILSCGFKKEKSNSNSIYNFILKFENEKEIIPDYITLKIHVCGISDKDLGIADIFSNNLKNIKDKTKGDKEFHMNTLYWIFKLHSKKLDETTFNDICNEITKDRDTLNINIKQNTILYFSDNEGESDNINKFLKTIEKIGYVYRPRMIFVTHKKVTFNFKDNRYITNIICKDYKNRDKKDKEILFNKIFSTIWNIDCYFNERLNEMINFDIDEPINLFKGIETISSNHSINIFLTGLSRAGKSSFINLITGKLSALESTDKESVTSKLTEYIITPDDDKYKNNNFCIKLIDSPGMVFNFNDEFKNKNIVINSIKNAFDDDTIDKIDIVLFFFCEGNSLENTIDILKILNERKFTVLFIINRSIDDDNKEAGAVISFLKTLKLDNLININNFISCNLKSSGKILFYGMEKIWKRIYDIFQEENKLINDDLKKQMKNYVNKFERDKDLMDIYKEEKNSEKKNIMEKISKNKLFSKINEKTIIAKCINMVNKCYNTIIRLSSLNYENGNDDIEVIYKLEAILFIKIGNFYGYETKDIKEQFDKLKDKLIDYYQNGLAKKKKERKNLKKKVKKELEKKERKEKEEKEKEKLKLEDKKDSIYNKLKKIIEKDDFIEKIARKFKEFYKEERENIENIDGENNNIEIIGNISQNLFENKLRSENFIPYYIKYYNLYQNCFNFIKELSQKEKWENYLPEYIYTNPYEEEVDINVNDKNINIKNEINLSLDSEDKKLDNNHENNILENKIKESDTILDKEENNKIFNDKTIENKSNNMGNNQQNKIDENESINNEDKNSDINNNNGKSDNKKDNDNLII